MEEFLLGGMMEEPLVTTAILRHAEVAHGPTEIVSRSDQGVVSRSDWAHVAVRARRLAKALLGAGLKAGSGARVATLAWNSARHLELYYAVPGIGAVLHTLNPRLHLDDLAGIIKHAQDDWIFIDPPLMPLAEKLWQAGIVKPRWVVLADRSTVGDLSGLPFECTVYEDFLASDEADFCWPDLNERQAALLCYTSGTTGEPKGVLYSHRSTVLHAMALMAPDAQNLSARDTVLPVVPMFHANAWGLPYLSAMVGTKVVFPGPHVDGASLFALMDQERVTVSVGVPTVWWGLLASLREHGRRPEGLKRLFVGGASCPEDLGEAFQEEFGVEMVQGWGMTETSPVGTFSWPRHGAKTDGSPQTYQRQGRALFGIRLRLVDEAGQVLPWDDQATGELQVQGHWVARRYFEDQRPLLQEGWLATGDVARIDPAGSMVIVDRVKDMIRSGGEWISSIALESVALTHQGVLDAAAIAVPHPKWGERPLMIVVAKPGQSPSAEDILAHMKTRLVAWQVPDAVVFMEELPRTATGKVAKKVLRARFSGDRGRSPQ